MLWTLRWSQGSADCCLLRSFDHNGQKGKNWFQQPSGLRTQDCPPPPLSRGFEKNGFPCHLDDSTCGWLDVLSMSHSNPCFAVFYRLSGFNFRVPNSHQLLHDLPLRTTSFIVQIRYYSAFFGDIHKSRVTHTLILALIYPSNDERVC